VLPIVCPGRRKEQAMPSEHHERDETQRTPVYSLALVLI
jgi:hypothetical protein